MYKTRNTGTGNGLRGTRGIGGMLYSGECPQTFRGMSPNIRGMSPNIPGNVVKNFGENNLWHVVKHSVESIKGFG